MDKINKKLLIIIGMPKLRVEIKAFAKGVLYSRARSAPEMLVLPEPAPHMTFFGNSGTGKTTVARLMAGKILSFLDNRMTVHAWECLSTDILYCIGVTKSPKLIEIQKSDLMGQFVGHTEKENRSVIQKSRNGVLFVDEAYRLTPADSPNDFGRCALDELMREMDARVDKHDPVILQR